MKAMYKYFACAGAAAMLSTTILTQPALGCGQTTPPPPRVWIDHTANPDGLRVYVELGGGIFGSQFPDACACGIGLGSLSNPLDPESVEIKNIRFGILKKFDDLLDFTPIPPFDALGPDPLATAGFQQGPEPPDPQFGAPTPGSIWFGFGGIIPPVEGVENSPEQVTVACFDINILSGSSSALTGLPIQLAAGLADPNNQFAPRFEPGHPHAASYSGVSTLGAPLVPTVSEWGLIILSLLLLTAGTIVIRRSMAQREEALAT